MKKRRISLIAAAMILVVFTVLSFPSVSSAACIQPPSGMVSWWDAEGNANDLIGTNHGTLMNGATFAAGKVGQAFSFDGLEDYVAYAPSSALDFGIGDFTIDAWIYPTALESDNAIVSRWDAVNGLAWDFRLGWGSAGADNDKLYFFFGDAPNSGIKISGSVSLNQWHYVVVVRRSGILYGYLDGVEYDAGIQSAAASSPNARLRIGNIPGYENSFFGGLIDEVEIFVRALTAEEITAIYNAGSAGKCKPVSSYMLTVLTAGTGGGTVTSEPAGIDCGSDCEETYDTGTTVTLTAVPEPGSGFAGWSGACTGMGNCTVEMTGNQTVTATFQVPTFTDVPADHWAFGWIEIMYANDITTGYPDGTYRPTGNVTRGQMAVFIIRALFGDTFDYELEAHFTDVPNTHSLFEYIQKMYDEGITTGYTDGTYRPSQNVQRSQMANFIIKAMYPGGFSYTLTPYFSDVPSVHWAFQYVQRMYDDAITTGYTDGTYRPSDYVNRAQMAAFIGRAFLGME